MECQLAHTECPWTIALAVDMAAKYASMSVSLHDACCKMVVAGGKTCIQVQVHTLVSASPGLHFACRMSKLLVLHVHSLSQTQIPPCPWMGMDFSQPDAKWSGPVGDPSPPHRHRLVSEVTTQQRHGNYGFIYSSCSFQCWSWVHAEGLRHCCAKRFIERAPAGHTSAKSIRAALLPELHLTCWRASVRLSCSF